MQPANILWTGGWDSTFRVLYVALVERRPVQPHYLIDPERQSTPFERNAIDRIRTAAIARGGSIAPPLFRPIDTIPITVEEADKYETLVRKYGIGAQYRWITAYAARTATKLELCIHRDDRAHAGVVAATAPGRQNKSRPITAEEAPETLFLRLSFPLLASTKTEMLQQAHHHHFHDLMEQTWFCHHPTRAGIPCGFCNPCRWTIKEGLGHRLPPAARLRERLERTIIRQLPGYRLRRRARAMLRGIIGVRVK